MAWVHPRLDAVVAHLPGVTGAVRDAARPIAARARALLAAHYHEGHSRIVVINQDTDVLVCLEDEAALAIEYGHTTRSGRRVAGLHIIGRAAR